jgi:hypothetical protein
MAKSKVFVSMVLLIILASGLSGCATPASKDAIIVHSVPGIQHHQKTVAIRTQGGSETSPMDLPSISNSDFAKAIEESIIANGLFTKVIHDNVSDYLLNVNIINMSKPIFGASFTVSMEAAWSLSDPITKKAIMRKSIKSSHTATMGQAFAAVERFRLAVEGAARENIRLGLIEISRLQLE